MLEVASIIDGWRERTCADKPSAGVPPHITILFPFVPAARIDEELISGLGGLFCTFAPFSFRLSVTARFPAVLYLEPDPTEPFVRLTETIACAYPDFPPYEGAFGSVVPHLTVAEGEAEILSSAEAEVAAALPVRAEAREVLLLEEVAPDSARWRAYATLPLGAAA